MGYLFSFFPTFATAHPRYGGLYRRFSLSVSCLILHGRCVSISPSELQYRQLGHSASWQASSGSLRNDLLQVDLRRPPNTRKKHVIGDLAAGIGCLQA